MMQTKRILSTAMKSPSLSASSSSSLLSGNILHSFTLASSTILNTGLNTHHTKLVAKASSIRFSSSTSSSSSSTPSSSGGSSASTTSSVPPPSVTSATSTSSIKDKSKAWLEPSDLTPSGVVQALSQHIIGQEQAKRAIAIALRNRWRRMRLPQEQQDEIIPKNILMVGPTGCGKTEIARRLAKLCRAPFVKVEATKFTEVGYHGRDVDTIIKDLLDASLQLVKELKTEQFRDDVKPIVEDKLVKALTGVGAAEETHASFLQLLRDGSLEDREVVVDVPVKETSSRGGGCGAPDMEVSVSGMGSGGATIDIGELMQRLSGGSGRSGRHATTEKRLKIKEARIALEDAEIDRRLSTLDLRKEAITLAEQNGIVFIDEIDKLISNRSKHSGDASSEGVQRDLLPLIEGTVVEVRKFGNVRTDYMLFVASGAFHEHKPSELLPELQGRLPIRVELKGLEAKDLERILTETKFNMLEQQKALLSAEGIEVNYEKEAISEIAKLAADVNRSVENIGARRLHTVIEKIMEDISFNATEIVAEAKSKGNNGINGSTDNNTPATNTNSITNDNNNTSIESSSSTKVPIARIVVDKELVRQKLLPLLERSDFSKFIL